jgi:uncharacterized protein YcfJ
MNKSPFTRAFLTAGIGLLMSGCASADHGHKYQRDYAYARYDYVDNRYDNYGERDSYGERGNYGDYGRVLDARPIYRQVAIEVPHESCRVETIAREERRRGGDSFGGTVVGGLVGAAIGHEIGNGRGAATAVGGLIGASIGNDAARGSRSVSYRDQEVCRQSYHTEYEQRIVGYDVSYSYQGRIYQTRTDRHPGDRIALDVAVRPRD